MNLSHVTKSELAERVEELEALLGQPSGTVTSSSGRTTIVTVFRPNGSGSFSLSRDDRMVNSFEWERESGSEKE